MNAVVHLPVLQSTPAPAERPRTRGDCLAGGCNAVRPCPWVSCEHHALLTRLTNLEGAAISSDDAVALLDTMPTCTLDVADFGPGVEETTLEAVGQVFGVTHERIRQIEAAAQKKLKRRVEHLRDDVQEDPDPELRPARCGPVPASEQRTWTPAPAQHAHLPGPADVADGEGQMWCGHMGVALRAKLCVQRHTARGKGSAMSGAAGRSYPTYPDCARCPDGASVAARIGAEQLAAPSQVDATTAPAPEPPTAPTSAPINWFGDDEGTVAANDIDAPAVGATEDDVSKKVMKAARTAKDVSRANAGRVTVPAPDTRCSMPGCIDLPQGYRESLDPLLRPLCKRHRLLAQGERTKRLCTTQEAVDIILRRAAAHADGETVPEGSREISEAARHDLHAEEVREATAAADEHELTALRARVEAAEAESTTAREQLRAADEGLARVHADLDARATELRQVQGERDEVIELLAAARQEITRLTGEGERLREEVAQVRSRHSADLAKIVAALVDGTALTWSADDIVQGIETLWGYAREAKAPWLRLERIYKAVHPESLGCWWTIERDTRPDAGTSRGWVAEIHDREDVEGHDAVRTGYGTTPEAAIAQLVQHVEEMALDVRAEIDAALEHDR